MTKFEQALKAGYTEEEIRDRILERDSDRIRKATEAGYNEDEIFSRYEERFGMPKSLVLNEESKETEVVSPEVEQVKSEFDIKRKKIEDAKSSIDSFGYTDEQKEKVLQSYELGLKKIDSEEEAKKKELQNKGKIIPKDEKEYSALERHLALAETTARGAGRPVLGLLRLGEGITDALGLTDSETTMFKDWIVENEKDIIRIQEESNLNTSMDFSDLGQIAVEFAPPLLAMKVMKGFNTIANLGKVALAEGFTMGVSSAGTAEENNGEVKATTPEEATATGLIGTAGVYGVGKVVNKVMAKVSGASVEAKLLADKIGMSEDEFFNTIKDIPKDQQALKIAEMGGADVLGNYKQALKDSDKVKIKLSDDIQKRTDKVNEAVRKSEFNDVKSEAELAWKEMEAEVSKSGIKVDSSSLTENIDKIKLFSGVDETAKSKIQGLENRLLDNPELPLDYLLTIRKQVNEELGKAKGKPSFEYYDALKSNIDELIDNNIPSEYTELVKSTQDIYTKYKTQENLIDIIKQSETKESVTGASKTAIDYAKARNLIEEQGLQGSLVEQTANTLQELDKKFNTDFEIMKSTKTMGTNTEEGALGVWSKIIGTIKNRFWVFGEYGNDVVIQRAITNAIKKGNTPLEYLDNLVKEKDIPLSIRKELVKNTKNIDSLKKSEQNKIKAMEAMLSKAKEDSKLLLPYNKVDTYVTSRGTASPSMNVASKTDEMARAVESRKRGGDSYNPRGKFQDPQVKPKPKTEKPIEGKIIPSGGKSKPEVLKRAEEVNIEIKDTETEISRLKKEMKANDKSKSSKEQKRKRNIEIGQKIREANAKLVTLKRKLPKVK